MLEYTQDYLLNKAVHILQPKNGYRASTDAVFLASLLGNVKENESILDVGSGTGAVSLCVAKHFPKNPILGIDIQPDLVELSNKSAFLNGFENLKYKSCDLTKKEHCPAHCSFHHVLTNPPYYDDKQPVSPNPSKALAHNFQVADLKVWLTFCLKMLRPFGFLYLIYRADQADRILQILSGKVGGIRVIPFYTLPNRPAGRILLIAQKDSKAPLSVLPPFFAYNADGTPSERAENILRGGKSFFDH